MTGLWRIIDDAISKDLKILQSNKKAKSAFEEFIRCVDELEPGDDPTRFSMRKARLGKGIWGYELTRSLRLVYRIDFDEKLFILTGLGDHKAIWKKG